MRQGGEPQGVQVVRQGEPTPYHCDFNSLYVGNGAISCRSMRLTQQTVLREGKRILRRHDDMVEQLDVQQLQSSL